MRRTWCHPCAKARDLARLKAYWKTPKGKITKKRNQATYYGRNRVALNVVNKAFHDKLALQGILIMGTRGPARYIAKHIAHVKAWRAHRRKLLRTAELNTRLRSFVTRPVNYPYVREVAPHTAELLAVNALVPRWIPGREDVCQNIMLAIFEGRTTVAELKRKRAALSAFCRAHIRESFEAEGYAVSLDAPRKDGRSMHDLIASDLQPERNSP